jgi:heme A synthase
MVLPVRLGNAHIQLTAADGIDVVNRTTGRFDRAANAMILASLVYQAADCATGGIVDPGYATCTYGYEILCDATAILPNTFMIISFDCCADFYFFMQYSLSALAELP